MKWSEGYCILNIVVLNSSFLSFIAHIYIHSRCSFLQGIMVINIPWPHFCCQQFGSDEFFKARQLETLHNKCILISTGSLLADTFPVIPSKKYETKYQIKKNLLYVYIAKGGGGVGGGGIMIKRHDMSFIKAYIYITNLIFYATYMIENVWSLWLGFHTFTIQILL